MPNGNVAGQIESVHSRLHIKDAARIDACQEVQNTSPRFQGQVLVGHDQAAIALDIGRQMGVVGQGGGGSIHAVFNMVCGLKDTRLLAGNLPKKVQKLLTTGCDCTLQAHKLGQGFVALI